MLHYEGSGSLYARTDFGSASTPRGANQHKAISRRLLMAITFKKRQKEMKRLEKRREKEVRRAEKKLAKKMQTDSHKDETTASDGNLEQRG
jgi:hypothetical protein